MQSENQTPTYEQVVAMRHAADSAERTFNKLGLHVSSAVNLFRYLDSELIVAKRKNLPLRVIEIQAERDEAKSAVDLAELRWNEQLDLHDRLWAAYCVALEAYNVAQSAAEEVREDEEYLAAQEEANCTFCGEKYRDCGGDHGDEMRQIMRESCSRSRGRYR
jgi:antitoxin component of RelBE/YafQ-DinJ toxin-antitoxin module